MATRATIFKLYQEPEPGRPRYGVRFGTDPLPTAEEILVVGFLEGSPGNFREILGPGFISRVERPSFDAALEVARVMISHRPKGELAELVL